jgi:TRAP-type C4-dicarboxylate transport system substrate-binding protein
LRPVRRSRFRTNSRGGSIDEGDLRDRLCKKFAAELEKRTKGAVTAQVYPIPR